MKVGSLVECVIFCEDEIFGRNQIEVGTILTVRKIKTFYNKYTILWFEELIGEMHPTLKTECGYGIEKFREVQPPMSLEFIEELQFVNV